MSTDPAATPQIWEMKGSSWSRQTQLVLFMLMPESRVGSWVVKRHTTWPDRSYFFSRCNILPTVQYWAQKKSRSSREIKQLKCSPKWTWLNYFQAAACKSPFSQWAVTRGFAAWVFSSPGISASGQHELNCTIWMLEKKQCFPTHKQYFLNTFLREQAKEEKHNTSLEKLNN